MAVDQLTGKQQAFIIYYLSNGFNGFKAAQAGGYKGSDETLRSVAKENLTKPHIRAVIDEHMKQIAMNADEVIARLAYMGRGT